MPSEVEFDKSKAQPWYGASDPMHLFDVDRVGHPPVDEGDKPVLVMRFYFTRIGEELPFYITFIMDPDGAVENFLAAPEHVEQMTAHFSSQPAAEQPTEDSING